jgi:lysyl-tRNA synthetase class 2
MEFAGLKLRDFLPDRTDDFRAAIAAKGIRVAPDDSWDDLFFRVMAEKIEPFLGRDVPAILHDYPTGMASLSRRKPGDDLFAERFEMYVCGIELANAFSELTDAAEQRARFKTEMAQKQKLYGETYPPDEDFFAALDHGLPESGGIALGVDRLCMLASGAEAIEDTLWAGKPGF